MLSAFWACVVDVCVWGLLAPCDVKCQVCWTFLVIDELIRARISLWYKTVAQIIWLYKASSQTKEIVENIGVWAFSEEPVALVPWGWWWWHAHTKSTFREAEKNIPTYVPRKNRVKVFGVLKSFSHWPTTMVGMFTNTQNTTLWTHTTFVDTIKHPEALMVWPGLVLSVGEMTVLLATLLN